MKPFKSAVPLAKWLLRIALLVYVFSAFFGITKTLAFNNLNYFFALFFIVFAVLLVIGGLLPKPNLTVVSGLIILILSVIKMVLVFSGTFDHAFLLYLMPASIGFYFTARGNLG